MSFMSMAYNYEDRKLDRYEKDGVIVDTCLVTDGDKPYETAVLHPQYHGHFIVVEDYDTTEQAKIGHAKWVKIMTTEPLPEGLSDCCNGFIGQVGQAMGCDFTYPRKQ